MEGKVLFSIVIPTYNRAEFVVKTIASLIGQEFSNFEIIVVDDGSTDDTRARVTSISDPRVNYFYKQNGERGAARNFGCIISKGKYINFFDSDDYAYPNHLKTAARVINDLQPPFFHLGYHVIEEKKIIKTVKPEGILNDILIKGNLLSCNNVFLTREIALAFPFSEDRLLSGSEDWLLWLILSSHFEVLGFANITSVIVQHGGRSMNLANGDHTLRRVELLLKELGGNDYFMSRSGNKFQMIQGSVYVLVALDFALEKSSAMSFKYLRRSVRLYPALLFTKRPYAVLKYLLKNI